MKKAAIFAIFILAAAAVASTNAEMKKRGKEFLDKTEARAKSRFMRRDDDDDECKVITCGKIGDTCDDNTICQILTECKDDICRLPIEGDPCDYDYECFDDDLYCDHPEGEHHHKRSDSGECKRYDREGDNCTGECITKDISLVCDRDTNTCKYIKAKIGEECQFGTVCQDGSYCNASIFSTGYCIVIPETAGEDCNLFHGCNEEKYVYCSSETKKCVDFPVEGERCYMGKCNSGYFCNKTGSCRELKDVMEGCVSSSECKDGLVCASTIKKCVKEEPEEGDYCNKVIECDDDHRCINNTCVVKDGTCDDDDDCKYIYYIIYIII